MTGPLIRPARETDLGFVFDTWRQSFKADSYLFRMDRDLYTRLMNRHLGAIVKDVATLIDVACNPDDEDTILGFAASTGPALHYVYVREALRKHGIARELLTRRPLTSYTFSTAAFVRRIRPAELGWTFAPRTERSHNGKFSVEMG
jgi:GNAT superfamily N-acetyltransferase